MRLPQMHSSRSIRLNMTPLIDVVFLLIIFFLVSSHLARQETQLELDLPKANSSQPEALTPAPRITFNVLSDGQVLLGSSEATATDIARRLRYERDRTNEDLEVRIRGDRHVPYGVIEPILLACSEAGIWKVSFAVVGPE